MSKNVIILNPTVLQRSNCPSRIFKASITMHPAMTALVVAIAGIILPASKIKKEMN